MDTHLHEHYILVGGSAESPQGTGIREMYRVMSVSFLVDRQSHCIAAAHFNVISPLSQQYLSDLAVGYCMDDPVEPLLEMVRTNAFLSSSNAVMQAIKAAFSRYRDFQNASRLRHGGQMTQEDKA